MKPQEKKNKVIIALAQAYEQRNTSLIDRIESILIPEEQKLPEPLQKLLDKYGNTPIAEPEVYELGQTKTLEDLKFAAVKDLNIDDFDAMDVGLFANKVWRKITDKIDTDGKYKTTPTIDSVRLPKTTQLRVLRKLATDGADEETLKAEIFKIAGVKQEDLTEWEKDLVVEMTLAFAKAVDRDTIGNYADRTPFARYIKN